MTKKLGSFSFIIVLLIVSLYYDYDEIIFKRPQSVHYWRQSDNASFALNYYQYGLSFLEPETHNLNSDNNKSGKVVSEFPLLYFTVANLYKIFGYHEFLYRLLNCLIFLIGLYYLFKTFRHFLQDWLWATCLTLVLFTSPVIVYYANNFLTDTTALAFIFIGWYHLIRFFDGKNTAWLIKGSVFFLLAALLKITAMLSAFALLGIFVIVKLSGKLFASNFKKAILPLLGIFFIVVSWFAYAKYYNGLHGTYYLSTTIFPIWNLEIPEINQVVDKVMGLWFYQYFHLSIWTLLLVGIFFILYRLKETKFFLLIIPTLLLLGTISFILLQFIQFNDHDYYVINLFILPIFILFSFSEKIRRVYPAIFKSYIIKTGLIILLIFNIVNAKGELIERYEGWWNDYGYHNDLEEIEPYLRSIGIKPEDKVISLPDKSNLSLYLMNQKGWTEYVDKRYGQLLPIYYNRDENGIKQSINREAQYLIVNGLDELIRRPFLKKFTQSLKGTFRDIYIFDLNSRYKNFSLPQRLVKETIACDAEVLTLDSTALKSKRGTHKFLNIETLSQETSLSGSQCVKINDKNPFGMTLVIDSVFEGESFKVSVMRKGSNELGKIVACGENVKDLYITSEAREINSYQKGDWSSIYLEFFIPKALHKKMLKIYLWNPDERAACFDDFIIVWFKSPKLVLN